MGKKSMQNAMLATLYTLSKEHGVVLEEKAHGHFQIKGQLLVNYYPFSKNRTAYVSGTKEGVQNVDPLKAVKMASTAPELVPPASRIQRRANAAREHRRWLIEVKKRPWCHWCQCALTLDSSTLEHVIPLARGGLDQRNNMTLACKPCNEKRGHDMPELAVQLIAEVPPHMDEPVVLPVAPKPALLTVKLDTVPAYPPVPELVFEDLSYLDALSDIEKREALLDLRLKARSMFLGVGQLIGNVPRALRGPYFSAEKRCLTHLKDIKDRLVEVNVRISRKKGRDYDSLFRSVAREYLHPEIFDVLHQETEKRKNNHPQKEELYEL